MLWWTVSQLKSKNPAVRQSSLEKLGESEDETHIPTIAAFLKDPESVVRAAAASALGKLGGEKTIEPLAAAVTDPQAEVRLAVVKALKAQKSQRNEAMTKALVVALNDDSPEVAGHAAQALRQLGWEPETPQEGAAFRIGLGRFDAAIAYGSAAIEPLARLTRNAPFHLCIRAIEALAHTGDPQAVKPLLDCLKHPEDIVRSCAAGALGQIGDARAVEPLLLALKEQNKQIVLSACGSLARLSDHRAVEPLIALLSHAEAEVRGAALEALGKLRDVRATPAVLKLLKDPETEVREGAAFCLGLLKDENAIEPLLLALTDLDSSVRQAAIRALRLTDPYWERSDLAAKAVPELENCLKSKEYWVRQSAADVLSKLGRSQSQDTILITESDAARQKRRAAGETLLMMLKDRDRDFRLAAAEALARMNFADAIPGLAAALADSDRAVQTASAKALDKLRWQPEDANERARLIVTLEKWADAVALGPVSIDALADAVSWREDAGRRRAIDALVQIAGEQAISALVTLAANPSEAIRAEAKAALSLLGHASAQTQGAGRFAT
jgi:HEAT repeat protein